MNQTNFDIIELDKDYSTTRRLIKADPKEIESLVKQSNKPEDKFETVLFFPEGEGRQGEGGLRTKGYFKTGGIIGENTVIPAKTGITEENCHSHDNHSHSRESGNLSLPETKPLITVVTVVFNGEKFLEETILSVINQTYDNVEYIIIDGGSNDGTLNIIKKYEHAIDYWVSEKDKGIYDAMNKGIRLLVGDGVNFLNAGDYFIGDVFGKCMKIPSYLPCKLKSKNEIKPYRLNNYRLGMPISHQAMVFKNKYLYDLNYEIASDYDYFLNNYFRYGMGNSHSNGCVVYDNSGLSNINYIQRDKETLDIIRINFSYFYVLFFSFKSSIKSLIKRFLW